MRIPRGYQSTVTLSDGRIFNLGGSWSGGQGGKNGEVYTDGAGWAVRSGALVAPMLTADRQGVYRADNHGWFFAGPGGTVFQAGPSRAMNWYSTAGNGTVTVAGARGADGDAMNGTATMYDVGRVLTVGGAPDYQDSNATRNAHTIDISGGPATSPTVRQVSSMTSARAYHNSIVLPDGKVLVVGGQAVAKPFTDANSAMQPELWSPATQSFTAMAPMAVPRNYHSSALLLPDGRVFSGGGGLCGGCSVNHADGQIFSPPYLFAADGSAAPRPAITSAPTSASLGATISVSTDRAVTGFALVRYGADTHTVNTDQRRIPLAGSGGTSHSLRLSADGGVLVPGPYMLFALTSSGVPSVSRTISIR
jgi:galactose oxidase